jgi:hypothetical protein
MEDLRELKNQWQAQPVAQPAAADVVVLLEAVSALLLALALVLVLLALSPEEALSLAAAATPEAGAAVPPEPPLKSVAYQPEPLS